MKTRNVHLLTGGASLALGGFVCTVLTFAQLPQTHTQTAAGRSGITFSARGCANAWAREPVLIYDSTGSTLLGPSHVQLSVYSDGLATFSRIDPTDPDGADVMVRTLPVEIVQDLGSALKVVKLKRWPAIVQLELAKISRFAWWRAAAS